jgi:hypothetical protein
MILLPVAGSLAVLVVPEIVLVLRLGQPSPHDLALPGLAAVGFEAIALALSTPIIGKKKFLAVQALASGLRRLHRFQNEKEPSIRNRSQRTEENPVARRIRAEKKEEEFSANLSKKIQRKKIPF